MFKNISISTINNVKITNKSKLTIVTGHSWSNLLLQLNFPLPDEN